jgi:two-component system chemotaxis sensor kinase CheA
VEEKAQAETGVSFLIFEDRARERTAVPLNVVERIESVPLRQIEYAGGRALLQYRGELLPLTDEGNVLPELEAVSAEDVLATVLIVGSAGAGGRMRMGMVVRQVLDVSAGTVLDKDEATGDMELAIVKEKLTTIHRDFDAKAASSWKEVA